jgi:hypothetical protein
MAEPPSCSTETRGDVKHIICALSRTRDQNVSCMEFHFKKLELNYASFPAMP